MDEKSKASVSDAETKDAALDYDDLPSGDLNPMWEVAIGIGILLGCMGAIIAFN